MVAGPTTTDSFNCRPCESERRAQIGGPRVRILRVRQDAFAVTSLRSATRPRKPRNSAISGGRLFTSLGRRGAENSL